ncbi:UDP-galactose transporter [Chloropicon primus]|uniref:UDP-galactose transporter n=1 Tax=Chloropicon primus TaxID=1764295 RepID=A0A5B8MC82_9CHLO|nr:UDP-galactose transporter [Chloropicon primus]UPQ97164.1 UDP-galactose transporter [Chloropicon primus]|eukprot:QDZ17949.1 UDP-galactose transporter [Chloropicon primus]
MKYRSKKSISEANGALANGASGQGGDAKGAVRKRAIENAFFWALNVGSSVSIIMVNKQLMGSSGYDFSFATTLCAMHYFVTSIWTVIQARFLSANKGVSKGIGYADLVIFTMVADLSIISLNTSLQVNAVPFYQIAKLGIIPCTCMVETMWLKKVLTKEMVAALLIVMIGVSIVTVTELKFNTSAFGVVVALMSTFCSTMQQVLCGYYQKKNSLTGSELLRKVAPLQATSIAVMAPFMDYNVSGKWVTNYEWSLPSASCLLVSCCFAVLVNVSQFLCLGRFSAVSYQVVGHAKTILVLLIGWLCFGGVLSSNQAVGMTLAVTGMILYGVAGMRAKTKEQSSSVLPVTHGNGDTARAQLK